MSLIFYDGKGKVACFDRGPLLTGGQGKYLEPVRHVGDIGIFHFNANATVHIVTRFIEKLTKKKGYKQKPFPLDKLAKKLAEHRAALEDAEIPRTIERALVYWPYKNASIITIEKGGVAEQGLTNPVAMGYYESQAHGAFHFSKDIMKVMESLRKKNMSDGSAEIIITNLKGSPQ